MPPCVTQMRWKCWSGSFRLTRRIVLGFFRPTLFVTRYSRVDERRTGTQYCRNPQTCNPSEGGPHYSNEANQCSDRTTYTTYMRTSCGHAKKQCAMRGVYVCIPSIPTIIGLKQGRSKGQGPRFSETAALCFHINKRDSI